MARKKEPTGAIASKKKKGEGRRKGKAPDAPTPPKISDEARDLWWGKALRAYNEADKVRLEYRSKSSAYQQVLKDAKKAGMNTAAIRRNIADRDRDPIEVAQEHQEYERLRGRLGVPVGAKQANLFDKAEDRGTMQAKAYQAGYTDGKSGQACDKDRYPKDTDLQGRYANGHADGKAEVTAALGGGAKKNGGAEAAQTH